MDLKPFLDEKALTDLAEKRILNDFCLKWYLERDKKEKDALFIIIQGLYSNMIEDSVKI